MATNTDVADFAGSEAGAARSDHMRCTMATIIHSIGSIKDKLTERHYAAMRKTPFYLLLECVGRGRLQTNNCRKTDANIIAIVQLFNTDSKEVRLGMQEVGFTIADVKYIFGIVDGNRRLDVQKGERKPSRLADRLFPSEEKITQKLLRQKLEDVVAGEEEVEIEDTARLLCLILISSLFFASSGLNIVWGWLDIVEDLDKIKSYDWCSKILDTLLQSMTTRKHTPNKINGCTVFLLYWLCEHTNIIAQRKTDDGMNIPRVLKWHLPDMWSVVTRARLLELPKQKVVMGQLTPTVKEMQMYGKLDGSLVEEKRKKSAKKGGKGGNDNVGIVEKIAGTSGKDSPSPKRMINENLDKPERNDTHGLLQQISELEGKLVASDKENISLLNEVEEWKDRVEDLETQLKQKNEIISDLERKGIQSRVRPMQGSLGKGTDSVDSEEVNYEAINFNAIRRLGEKVKKLESMNWEVKNELQIKEAEVCGLKNELGLKVNDLTIAHETILDLQQTIEGLRVTLEHQKENTDRAQPEMNTMADFDDDFESHVDSQAVQERAKRRTPNSMYGKIKTRKRKAVADDAFDYGKKRTEAKDENRSSGTTYAVTSKERVSFFRSLDRKNRGHCGRMVSEECVDTLINLKKISKSETVYYSPDKKVVVDVTQLLNILNGEFIDNFVIDAFSHELVRSTGGDCVIVTSNCWSFVQGGKIEANQIFQSFVEANKAGKRLIQFPFNSCGGTKNTRPYHWTLLVWDTTTEEWSHYNSMKPRHNNVHDPWFEDAAFLKTTIESKTKPPPDFGFSTQDIAQAIISVDHLPQQGEGKNDCAMYVCYYMAQLVQKRSMFEEMNQENMNKFKARVVESIVMKKWLI